MLLLAGAAATGGQFCITAAYRQAPAKEIAVFDYMQVFFAAILGYLFLDQVPKPLSFAGYAIIIGAAVLKWLFQRRSEKKAPRRQEDGANMPEASAPPEPTEETKKDPSP